MALIPTPALCLSTFPNGEKALKPVAVHYFSLVEGKKQTRACHAMMVCKQFSIMEPPVLVSAGIELIFFLVAGIVLCFGFSRRIMLITH